MFVEQIGPRVAGDENHRRGPLGGFLPLTVQEIKTQGQVWRRAQWVAVGSQGGGGGPVVWPGWSRERWEKCLDSEWFLGGQQMGFTYQLSVNQPSMESRFLFFCFFKIYLFIYSEREQRHRQRGEKQASCWKPDAGLDPGSPGSHPGLQAALRHRGCPESRYYQTFILWKRKSFE